MDHSTPSRTNKQQQHEEESTIFRSIPIQPGTGATMGLPPLKQLPLGMAPPSFGKLSLPSSIPKPVVAAQVAAEKPTLVWKVDAATIPHVPDYPLERTHMVCNSSDLTLSEITERIARVLEAQNLQCVFSDDEDNEHVDDEEDVLPGRVDCTAINTDLKFVVQLYKKNDSSATVVEVQRRRGSSTDFSMIRKALFGGLQQRQGQLPAKKMWSPPPFVPNPKFQVLPTSHHSSSMRS